MTTNRLTARNLAEELVHERLADASEGRVRRLTAIASYVAWRNLRDGHFSRGEDKTVRRALARDVSPADVELLVSLLTERPELFTAVDVDYWVDELDGWILEHEHTPYQGTGHGNEYASYIASLLAYRWPLLDEVDRPARWSAGALSWDDEVLRIGPTHSIQSVELAWREIVSIEPMDPWPEALIEWDTRGYGISRLRLAPDGDRASFGRKIEALYDAAEGRIRARDALRPGWLGQPRIEWEPVDRLPSADAPATGPNYRTAPARPIPVLAHRTPRGGLGVVLAWLASGPDNPFREQVAEALVTPEHVYVRRRGGTLARVPLATLRTRRGSTDAIYVFGRGTELLLTDRASCPVCKVLDEHLRGA